MNNHDLELYRDIFLEELDEQLLIMNEELLRIEREGASEAGIQSLFRAAHTVKGSSAAMGLESIKTLTHEMEQILDDVRNDQLVLTDDIINGLFASLDQLYVMKDSLNQSHDQLVNRHMLVIHISITHSSEMKLARSIVIYNKLQEHANIIRFHPSLDEELDDALYEHLNITCETSMDKYKLEQYLQSLMDVEAVHITPLDENIDSKDVNDAIDEPKSNAMSSTPHKSKASGFVRVNVEQLEHLINLVGELVIDQTRVNQITHNLIRKYNLDDDVKQLEHVIDHVNKVVDDLQDHIMKARMIPIEQLFNRFPRIIRDLSLELNKEVELTLRGSETELDRSLIQEIGDPLIHLIRNAMDHGIEDNAKRKQLGKPYKGQISIVAAHENNQVVIRVQDDGAGIDAEAIKKTAVNKELISDDEASKLSDYEAIQLIFQAGFSTTSEVSDVSGRGVGMDIVRSDIQRLNGLIDIETSKGKGTTFTIRLPLTLAIITGLLVEINTQTFILPMSSVVEITRMMPSEIKTINGEEVVMNRDQVIPLVRLQHVFKMKHSEPIQGSMPIVIAGSAEQRVAIAVDRLIGNQDIVIKSLGNYIGKLECISGSTILGDGQVAFILEVTDILKLGRNEHRHEK